MQRDLGDGTGDCFAACLASMLNIGLDEVPNFRRLQTEATNGSVCMVTEADKWLRSVHGKRIITIELYGDDHQPDTTRRLLNRLAYSGDDLVILSGESPRKTAEGLRKYHCVIGKPSMWGYEVVHDPHPEGGGIIGEPYGVKWIVPTA